MFRVFALVVALLGMTMASSAQAERRVALVVGNGAYTHAAALANPANDARAVAAALERLGFEVVSGYDLNNADLRKTVRAFADKLVGAEVAMFFYAGHGLQVGGDNYLIPVDAAIRSEADLDFNAVKLDLITRQLDREAKVKIIMLDACRDNPFEKELSRSMGKTRSATVKKGLAEVSNAGGTLIAFATDPGSVALDGDSQHSPFTAALLKHIEEPGIEIGLMMRRVTKDVFESTGERQRPWTNASLTGELYLKPGETGGITPAPASSAPAPSASGFDDRQLELAMWQAADKSGQAGDYEEYLKKYPNGQFAGLARNRLAALKNKPAGGNVNTATADPTRSSDQGQNRSADEAAELQIGLTSSDRVGIQRRLTLIGFDTRGIDGAFGPGTRNAISRWQQSRSFAPASGYLNAQQYQALIAQTEATYANWLQQERARQQAAQQQQQQPQQQPTATATPPQQQPQQQQGPSARDVLQGVGTIGDTIRIFRR
ncbi:MAG: caspase family protein [Alphaproteobacteria bacterium]|nr:caspase family protein [Alphaproteobacteria bacterium]